MKIYILWCFEHHMETRIPSNCDHIVSKVIFCYVQGWVKVECDVKHVYLNSNQFVNYQIGSSLRSDRADNRCILPNK